MQKMKTALSLLLCAAMILSLFGCGSPAPAETSAPTAASTQVSTEAPTEAPMELPAADLYTQAAQPLRDAANLAVELTATKVITTDTGAVELVSGQELVLTGIGTDAFTASVFQELDVGGYRDEFTEYFAGGTLYVNIYDAGYFRSAMTADAYLAGFAPAVLLDETLYAGITGEKNAVGTTLTFTDPAGPESWAMPAGAQFLDASGTATLSANGELTETAYTISYAQGGATVTLTFRSKAELYDGSAPKTPADLSAYKEVDSIDALRYYETAILLLCGSPAVSSTINHSAVCQAAACTLSAQTELHFVGTDKDHLSEIRYTATTDSSSASDTYSQTEHYEQGVYTLTADGAEPQTLTTITPEDMLDYILGYYMDTLPALTYITSVSMEDLSGLIYLEMDLSPEWGDLMNGYICSLLFDDEEFLNGLSSAYETTASGYYMVVDPGTGFPLAAGFTYGGVHTIDGYDYTLTREIDQTYRLADSGSYSEITGASLPEDPPENPATPLLYRVTGANGQEMYLLGTIHAGDARTAYLPDELYEALDNADALAVEADILAFEEQIETDPELAAQYTAILIDTNATPAVSQWDPEIYGKARKLLKAAGSYNYGMEYAKPYFWSSSIDNFFLSLSSLRSDKGVDVRLLERAKEQDKKILEIESTLFQMEMFSDFSPALQQLLLAQALQYTVADYTAELQALYELWCEGDEAAIRENLALSSAEMTGEEQALYDEYLDAMIIRRNEDMLDVAISYLESGDTVFYAVGLAHLLQANGLVDALRLAGYAVELIPYQ